MKLVLQADGREEHVEVVRDGDAWRVTVGEASYRVDAAALGTSSHRGPGGPGGHPEVTSLIFSADQGGDQYEIAAHALPRPQGGADAGDRYRVSLGADRPAVEVEVMDPLAHQARASHAGATGGGTRTVQAMMPGRVVTVLTDEGARVTAGQGVVVLEAMKMENEITAEGDGVVRRLFVEAGQAVDGGEPLFEIGPPEEGGEEG